MDRKITEESGVRRVADITPEGWQDIDSYHPHTTPWDYYGLKHWQAITRWLEKHGIQSIVLVTHETLLHPIGSGPGGRVRFGDNMLPGVYRVAVRVADAPAAAAALAARQAAIDEWCSDKGPHPDYE